MTGGQVEGLQRSACLWQTPRPWATVANQGLFLCNLRPFGVGPTSALSYMFTHERTCHGSRLAPGRHSDPRCGSRGAPGLMKALDDDLRFQLLRLLDQNPDLSQREIARELGLSLGAINYVLRALVDKGQIKVQNFRASDNKLRYAYILTPGGLEAKARLTTGFLRRKLAEYEALRDMIAALEAELDDRSSETVRRQG